MFSNKKPLPIDSLLLVLSSSKEDTSKVKLLKILCDQSQLENPELAAKYIDESLKLAIRLNFKKGIADGYLWKGYLEESAERVDEALVWYEKTFEYTKSIDDKRTMSAALNRMGILNKLKGEYNKALEYYFTAIKIDEAEGRKKYVAMSLGNIGVIYLNQGNYPKALEYDFKVLKIFEELGDKTGLALTIGNIGAVYGAQKNYSKALECYFKALDLSKEVGNKMAVARNLSNIGVIYMDQGNRQKALLYYSQALEVNEDGKNRFEIASCLGNIGLAYDLMATTMLKEQGQSLASDTLFNKAFEYYFKALKMDEEIQDIKGIASKYGNIGSLYVIRKNYVLAEEYLLKALEISTRIRAMDLQKDHNDFLSNLYTVKGNYKKAFDHYKQFSLFKDSLFNEEKSEELTRSEMNYEFEKKLSATQAEQDKKDAIINAENKKQKTILILVSCVLVLVFVFAGFVFRSLRITRKQKLLIELKNKETELQKKIIEEKNKDIMDSLRYAKRIQLSLLPTELFMERCLNK